MDVLVYMAVLSWEASLFESAVLLSPTLIYFLNLDLHLWYVKFFDFPTHVIDTHTELFAMYPSPHWNTGCDNKVVILRWMSVIVSDHG